MEKLDAILELLSDGEWHTLNEISAKKPFTRLPLTDLAQLSHFLAEYDFIELDERLDHFISVKLTQPPQEFMRKIKWIERAEER